MYNYSYYNYLTKKYFSTFQLLLICEETWRIRQASCISIRQNDRRQGTGASLVFPWIDRTKRIDVRAAAFAVPPQQFITCDGGIVEMGAEIQYGIVDVVTMVSEVADHQV